MAKEVLGSNLPDGTSVGKGTTQKISFYGVTPIVQRSGSVQATLGTVTMTQTSPFGFTTSAQGLAVAAQLEELRAALVALGLIAGS